MSHMELRFWGTRGSIPTPGRKTEKYGGNTTCVEVRCGDTILVFDAGSGIREMSLAWAREFGGRAVEASLLFTHLHWDHIQGFPFFMAGYQEGNRFTLYGENRPDGSLESLLGVQMRGTYFPVPLTNMQAELRFRDTSPAFAIGPLRVRTIRLPHPGGCLGYRIEGPGGVLVFATDCELDLVAGNGADVERDFAAAERDWPADLLEFFAGASVLVIDCQFTDEDYRTRRGWGHNALATAVDLARQAHPEMLCLFHHDPQSTDDRVTLMVDEAVRRLNQKRVRDMVVFAGREGLRMVVGKPQRPPLIPR